MKALINSQRGDTLGFGGGIKFRPVDIAGYGFIKRGAIDVGIEGNLIYYARRFDRGAATGPLIAPFVGASATVGKVEIGVVQYWLPENILLRGNTFDGPPEIVGLHGLSTPPAHWALASEDQAKRTRPMIFLRYNLNIF